jgi:dihydrofolate synthase/folylpolyglutamate synthase
MKNISWPFWPNPIGYRDVILGLSRVKDLLSRLQNPHLKLPPTIHIAGTNGKGSTLSFLRKIFEESSLLVHSYTSPHLVNFNERIILQGKEISDQYLTEILNECKFFAEKSPKIEVTFFEGITVAALLAFSKIKADVLLLEVGMGGRLDATNVLDEVLCSIITPISFDHQDFLGKSLKEISKEKAGIIKPNCPLIVGKQEQESLQTILSTAKELNSSAKIFGKDWQIKKEENGFYFKGFNQELFLPNPSLIGSHQIENASVAIACILQQKKFQVNVNSILSAIEKTNWPARLQKIVTGKFFNQLPKNFELYLDGSHNQQGAKTVKEFLLKHKEKKIYAIFSMLKDKNCHEFLKIINSEINQLFCLTIPNEPKSYQNHEILKIANEHKIKAKTAENFQECFDEILKSNDKNNSLIIICGSLYLAGIFLELM